MSVQAKTEQSPENGYRTPLWLVERVRTILGGQIDLDPCTTHHNPINARSFFTPDDDGILQSWQGSVYCNPPYGRTIHHWIDKAIGHDSPTVLLIPARTDSAWFQRLARSATNIIFLAGRLRFNDEAGSAPFPCALVGLRIDLAPLADLGWLAQ